MELNSREPTLCFSSLPLKCSFFFFFIVEETLKLWFGTKSKLSSHGTVTSVLGGGGQCFAGVVILEHLLPGC